MHLAAILGTQERFHLGKKADSEAINLGLDELLGQAVPETLAFQYHETISTPWVEQGFLNPITAEHILPNLCGFKPISAKHRSLTGVSGVLLLSEYKVKEQQGDPLSTSSIYTIYTVGSLHSSEQQPQGYTSNSSFQSPGWAAHWLGEWASPPLPPARSHFSLTEDLLPLAGLVETDSLRLLGSQAAQGCGFCLLPSSHGAQYHLIPPLDLDLQPGRNRKD